MTINEYKEKIKNILSKKSFKEIEEEISTEEFMESPVSNIKNINKAIEIAKRRNINVCYSNLDETCIDIIIHHVLDNELNNIFNCVITHEHDSFKIISRIEGAGCLCYPNGMLERSDLVEYRLIRNDSNDFGFKIKEIKVLPDPQNKGTFMELDDFI